MKKAQLQNGRKMLVVNTSHYVKAEDFATALADHYYVSRVAFDKAISRSKAKEVLKRGLFFHGLYGQHSNGYFEASFEEGERYNSIYSDALAWVKKNYKWLDDAGDHPQKK
jgi:hypothetical protein